MMVPKHRQDVSPGWESSSRGERAWKEVVDDLASRNAATRKAGRVEREAYDRGRQDARRTASAKRDAKLARRKP